MEKTGGGFFVTLPLDQTLRVFKEVGHGPFALYFWLCGRVTREYQATAIGIRVGAVFGSVPYTDLRIAEDLTHAGFSCDRFQVCKWRRRLAEKGLIAWVRTPGGLRLFVIGSDKFPGREVDPLSEWAVAAVCETLERVARADTLSELTHQVVKTDTPSCQNRHIQYKKLKGKEKETKSRQTDEDMFFEDDHLKITDMQQRGLSNEFADLRLDYPCWYAEFEAASEWIASRPGLKVEHPVGFMRKWLAGAAERGTQQGAAPAKVREPGWDDELDFPIAERPF